MYLTTHAASGIMLGAVTGNPAAAFCSAFAAHFVLDIIPHEKSQDLILDYPGTTELPRETIRRRTLFSLIDLFLVVTMTVWAFQRYGWSITGFLPVAAGIAGAVAPDIIVMLSFISDNSLLRKYFSFHNYLHSVISSRSIPYSVSIPGQGLLSALFLYSSNIF